MIQFNRVVTLLTDTGQRIRHGLRSRLVPAGYDNIASGFGQGTSHRCPKPTRGSRDKSRASGQVKQALDRGLSFVTTCSSSTRLNSLGIAVAVVGLLPVRC